MKKYSVSSAKIAATYIGTVVGAGFASGQEVLQFFTVFGQKGLYGLIAVTALFAVFGYIIMDIGYTCGFNSYHELIRCSGPRFMSRIFDFTIIFFLFGSLTVMIAGAGAIIRQQFNVSEMWGSLFLAVITVMTVFTGFSGVINSISAVVPFLLVATTGVCILSFFRDPLPSDISTSGPAVAPLINNWVLATILYISYNTVSSLAVLCPLGAEAKSRSAVYRGAALGSMGLGAGMTTIFFALYRFLPVLKNVEVPMAYIAGRASALFKVMYIVVLLAEIYTTAVGGLFGLKTRVAGFAGVNWKLVVIAIMLLSLTASRCGFANLVRYIYPIMGYCGIVIIVSLMISRYKKKFS